VGVRVRFRTTLVAILVGLVLASVAVVGVGGYLNARYAAEDLSSQALDQTAHRIEQQIGHILGVAAAQVDIYGGLISSGQLNYEDKRTLTDRFLQTMEVWEVLSYLSWTRERDGGYCQIQRIGERLVRSLTRVAKDPRRRPYYVRARGAGAPVWTETYVFIGQAATLDIPGLSRTAPIHDSEGRMLGVLTADFDLRALSSYLSRLEVGQGGLAVVVEQRSDGSRKVIGHPDAALLTRPIDPTGVKPGAELIPAEEIADARVRALLRQLPPVGVPLPERPAPLGFVADGQPWIGRYKRYVGPSGGGLSWIIAVVQPRSEVLGRVETGNQITLAIIGATALLAVMLAFWLSSKLSSSLRQLADDSRRIGEFDLDSGEPIRTRLAEIQQLVDAMEHMKTGLRGFRRYLPVKLVRLLHEQRQEPELGGEDRQVTLYFSDIVAFSAASERPPWRWPAGWASTSKCSATRSAPTRAPSCSTSVTRSWPCGTPPGK